MNNVESTTGRWGLWKIGMVASVASAVGNLLLMVVTGPLFEVPDDFGPLTIPPIILWSVIGALGAIGVYALVRKFSSDPHKSFMIIAVVVLFVSFVPDILLINVTEGIFSGAGWGAIIVLMIMHVISFAIVVPMLRKLVH
ncbi:MAG: hypothetical protein JKY98_07155 [Gammaproteobacteria bacterium]|nr:hypothetical protein [Gammaproteobacteria bacterium]